MGLTRQPDDDLPFATEGSAVADAGRFAGGEHLGQIVDGNVKNRFRAGVLDWAKRRGLPVVDSVMVVEGEGVTARVPIYEITDVTAVVRATAVAPVKMSLTIEPPSWTKRLFGGSGLQTGDAGFDRQWHVVASDAAAAHQLLDEECRDALREVGCWCRATYKDGEIEVRLDQEKLAGAHVLGGIAIGLLLARARVFATAYR